MAKLKKSKPISKPTTNLNKVSKPKQVNRKKSHQQPTRRSLRLKHTNFITEIAVDADSCVFGTYSRDVQSKILCHIFSNHFSLFEQIEMRRVCRLWHYNVKHIWAKTRSLVLTLKGSLPKPKMTTDLGERNFAFDSNVGEQPVFLKISNRVELSIGEQHFEYDTIDLLGDLFRNIEHLTIFYDHSCFYESTENLEYFLKQFRKIKSFSLIQMFQEGLMKDDFLTRIFAMVNKYLAPLHTLHLYLGQYNSFSKLRHCHLNKTLPYLQNFSISCNVDNLGKLLDMVGKSSPTHWPMQSISFSVDIKKPLVPVVAKLYEQNSKLSQIKRLELTGIAVWSLDMVFMNRLLDHSNKLECLHLCSRSHSIQFTIEWIEAIKKLLNLTELLLWDFEINIFEDWIIKPLPNIRKLTIVSECLLAHLQNEYHDVNNIPSSETVEYRQIYGHFLHYLSKQFPKLEHLRIRCLRFARRQKISPEIFEKVCFNELRFLQTLELIGHEGKSLISKS